MGNELMKTFNGGPMDLMTLGKVFAASGFFADSRDAAQAIVKIQAGAELGFPPVASMTGVHIIKGRVSLSANLIAAAIKRSGKYTYRIVALDDKACELEFFEAGQSIGKSAFNIADAKRQATQNVDKFPRNMLFARALSNGAKWYTPDVFGGPVYTPEELGAEVDDDGNPNQTPPPSKTLPPPTTKPEPVVLASPEQVAAIQGLIAYTKTAPDVVSAWLSKAGVTTWDKMPADRVARAIVYLEGEKAKMQKPAETTPTTDTPASQASPATEPVPPAREVVDETTGEVTAQDAPAPEAATAEQAAEIKTLLSRGGGVPNAKAVADGILKTYGIDKLSKLTKDDAAKVLPMLRNLRDSAAKATASAA